MTAQLQTQRLILIPSTLEHVLVELNDPRQLKVLLDAEVSSEWPSGEYDRDAMEFFRARFEEGGKEVEGWYGWYAVRKANSSGPKALVGAGGYFGPSDADGVLEVGYSILPEFQRRGYAIELVDALLARAFTYRQVTKVIGHTKDTNPASIGVLARCGFVRIGAGREAGMIRYERGRSSRSR